MKICGLDYQLQGAPPAAYYLHLPAQHNAKAFWVLGLDPHKVSHGFGGPKVNTGNWPFLPKKETIAMAKVLERWYQALLAEDCWFNGKPRGSASRVCDGVATLDGGSAPVSQITFNPFGDWILFRKAPFQGLPAGIPLPLRWDGNTAIVFGRRFHKDDIVSGKVPGLIVDHLGQKKARAPLPKKGDIVAICPGGGTDLRLHNGEWVNYVPVKAGDRVKVLRHLYLPREPQQFEATVLAVYGCLATLRFPGTGQKLSFEVWDLEKLPAAPGAEPCITPKTAPFCPKQVVRVKDTGALSVLARQVGLRMWQTEEGTKLHESEIEAICPGFVPSPWKVGMRVVNKDPKWRRLLPLGTLGTVIKVTHESVWVRYDNDVAIPLPLSTDCIEPVTETPWKVGMRVVSTHPKSRMAPEGTLGTIIDVTETHIRVKYDNGTLGNFREPDGWIAPAPTGRKVVRMETRECFHAHTGRPFISLYLDHGPADKVSEQEDYLLVKPEDLTRTFLTFTPGEDAAKVAKGLRELADALDAPPFKVGDRVRVIKHPYSGGPKTFEAVIADIVPSSPYRGPLLIPFPNGQTLAFRYDEVEKI